MDLLENSKMPLLIFNFVMIYIIHKTLVLLKNHLSYLKYSIFECFLKEYKKLLTKITFLITYNNEDIRNLFRWDKETKVIKHRILRDIKNLFEHEEENYYRPVTVSNFWRNNYIE